jgi:hypothetical protein
MVREYFFDNMDLGSRRREILQCKFLRQYFERIGSWFIAVESFALSDFTEEDISRLCLWEMNESDDGYR